VVESWETKPQSNQRRGFALCIIIAQRWWFGQTGWRLSPTPSRHRYLPAEQSSMARPARVSNRHQSTCVDCLGAGGDHLMPSSTATPSRAWPETGLHRARSATAGLAHPLPPGRGRPRAGHQRRSVLDLAPMITHLAFPVPLHRRRRGRKTKCSHERNGSLSHNSVAEACIRRGELQALVMQFSPEAYSLCRPFSPMAGGIVTEWCPTASSMLTCCCTRASRP
jgi:hypothetical protein